jgi:DNA replication protein DnaD
MNGWIKLHRQLVDKPIWKQSTPEQCKVLITLLMMANHEENEWEWGGKEFKVTAGQFVTSLPSIAQNSGKGISIKNVRTALERFEKLDFLASEPASHGRLITIKKWDTYQGDEEGDRQDNRQTGGRRVAANKNDKNIKNKEKEKEKESPLRGELDLFLDTVRLN